MGECGWRVMRGEGDKGREMRGLGDKGEGDEGRKMRGG